MRQHPLLKQRGIYGGVGTSNALRCIAVLTITFCFSLVALTATAQQSVSKTNQADAQKQPAPSIPDTVAGRHLSAYLQAFNAGNADAYRRFVIEHIAKGALEKRGVDERVARALSLYNSNRGFKLHSIERASDNEIVAIIQTVLTEEWLRLTLRVEPEPPQLISELNVEMMPPPASLTRANRMSEDEMNKQLTAYLEKLSQSDAFSGVVMIAKNGKPIFAKAYGLADKKNNLPNKLDTKFNLGSMNKMFTAVAIAQLAERGKLSFNDTISKHLPDYPNKQVAEKVTIHQLLTHTSGIGDYFNPKFFAQMGKVKTVSDLLPFFADEPLLFEPGQKFQYSNAGFAVLGLIIEKLSGESYYDYVKGHIFKPAGMRDTDSYEKNQEVPNLAMGYTQAGPGGRPQSGPRHDNTMMRPLKGSPAGGGYSTADDMLRFQLALSSHKLLSAKYTEIVTTGKVETSFGPGVKYAYGFSDAVRDGKHTVGHNGGAPGIGAQFDMFPELGYTTIVLTNYDPDIVMPITAKIRELLPQ